LQVLNTATALRAHTCRSAGFPLSSLSAAFPHHPRRTYRSGTDTPALANQRRYENQASEGKAKLGNKAQHLCPPPLLAQQAGANRHLRVCHWLIAKVKFHLVTSSATIQPSAA